MSRSGISSPDELLLRYCVHNVYWTHSRVDTPKAVCLWN